MDNNLQRDDDNLEQPSLADLTLERRKQNERLTVNSRDWSGAPTTPTPLPADTPFSIGDVSDLPLDVERLARALLVIAANTTGMPESDYDTDEDAAYFRESATTIATEYARLGSAATGEAHRGD